MMYLGWVLKYLSAGLIVCSISFSLIEWQKRQPDCHPMIREYRAGLTEHVSSIILWPIIFVTLIIKFVKDMTNE